MTERIVLVGNSTNNNRGCEAIARGTLAVFNAASDVPIEVLSGVIVHTDASETLVRNGGPAPGEPPQFSIRPRLSSGLVARASAKIMRQRRRYEFPGMAGRLSGATSVLEVGGDNYSLDYGRPYTFIDLDKKILRHDLPAAIWGASIGPFSSDPQFETEILAHLRLMDRIYVRESVSFAYLTDAGFTNVRQMADPAIFMVPEPPKNLDFDADRFTGAIGLNLSPFQARQVARTNTEYWATTKAELDALAEFGAELLGRLLKETDRPILLIPHVMAPEIWNNDHELLANVFRLLKSVEAERVALLPSSLSAPELKWAIGKCSVFAGSRTHATLGAISSGVPTLAFGYSRKATGLMRDLYGDDEMCLPGNALTLDSVMGRLQSLVARESELRARIASVLPAWRESTLLAAQEWLELCR